MWKMDFEVFLKPSSLGQIVNTDSFHLWKTHKAWPRAEVGRFLRRSSSSANFETAKKIFIEILHLYGVDEQVIQTITNFRACSKMQLLRDTYIRAFEKWQSRLHDKAQTVWLPLPYHPVWEESGVGGMLRSLMHSSYWQR